jgi:hypothetical protein
MTDTPDVETAAKAIYERMAALDPEGRKYPWQPGGNSHKQTEARGYAAAAFAAAPQPPATRPVDTLARDMVAAVAGWPGGPLDRDAVIEACAKVAETQYHPTTLYYGERQACLMVAAAIRAMKGEPPE